MIKRVHLELCDIKVQLHRLLLFAVEQTGPFISFSGAFFSSDGDDRVMGSKAQTTNKQPEWNCFLTQGPSLRNFSFELIVGLKLMLNPKLIFNWTSTNWSEHFKPGGLGLVIQPSLQKNDASTKYILQSKSAECVCACVCVKSCPVSRHEWKWKVIYLLCNSGNKHRGRDPSFRGSKRREMKTERGTQYIRYTIKLCLNEHNKKV